MGINKYYGGKTRYAKKIADVIAQHAEGIDVYIEPFCGWCSVMLELAHRDVFKLYEASDANESLICLLRETSTGNFVPPNNISKDEYQSLKLQKLPSALQAFAGICYSFNGQWFRGYGPQYNIRGYLNCDKFSSQLCDQFTKLSMVTFKHAMYQEYMDNEGCFFYLDPPYRSRTEKYKAFDSIPIPFDTKEFWEFTRKLSQKNTVLVSEYDAPDDFECVLEFPGKHGVEKVFKMSVVV
jgi:DNA adenine methylase